MILSPNDLKQYKTVTLNNGLRVLLINNQENAKAAAALAVNAGHFNDPKERQGLAHFLEHMLFLGTEKYPEGSEYQKFINQYGGSNNAWTATEHTCFFFDIHHTHFAEALDRFSQFFIAPLLSQEFVFKERQNIDAEFKLKLKDDIRRLYDVHKETINQSHPFSQFSVGNIDTLADKEDGFVRDEVQAFFSQFYRAGYMTLALEGPQSLDELSQLATDMFSSIEPSTKEMPNLTEPLYLPEHQSITIDVCPVKNDHQLIISFAMPSIDQYYLHKPESVLAYLIGHEGPGSILSLLKKNQWAMGLTAGSGINGSNFKDFNISISLTEHGEAYIDEIIELVFSYITLLKSAPLPDYYYQEKQAISALSFNYHEKMSPLDSVCQLVLNMQHYPEEDYIFGDYVMKGMCDETINLLLSYLTASNMRIIHISQNNTFDKTSFWYQVPYRVTSLSKDKLNHWASIKCNEQLYLPSKNPYIVKHPTVYKDSGGTTNPKVLFENGGLTAWFKQDSVFKVPKGYIYIGIDSPLSVLSPKNIAMTRLFVDLYSDTIIEENYDAELAGIHYHLYAHQGGVTLQLSGTSARQIELLKKLLHSLKNHEIDENRFNLLKKQLINHWNNADKSKSISQLFSTLSSVMQPSNPLCDVLSASLSKVTFQQYSEFCQQLFNQVTLEVLIHGNWLEEHAKEIVETINQSFLGAYSEDNQVKCPVVDITDQQEFIIPIYFKDHDHATVIYNPQPKRNDNATATTMITSHLLSPLFFQEMRTEKQYGYLVGVGYVPINRYPGIAFYIQSPETNSQKLTLAIDEFISSCSSKISEISNEDWQHVKNGLASQLQEKDNNLRIKSQRFWGAICNKDTTFEHKNNLIKAILALEINDILDFIETLITANNPDRLILISEKNQNNNSENALKGTVIKDLTKFINKNKRKH